MAALLVSNSSCPRFLQGEKRVLFDVSKDGAKIAPKFVPPEDEQEANESRRYVFFPFYLSQTASADGVPV